MSQFDWLCRKNTVESGTDLHNNQPQFILIGCLGSLHGCSLLLYLTAGVEGQALGLTGSYALGLGPQPRFPRYDSTGQVFYSASPAATPIVHKNNWQRNKWLTTQERERERERERETLSTPFEKTMAPPPGKKRPATAAATKASQPSKKKIRAGVAIKTDPDIRPAAAASSAAAAKKDSPAVLKQKFIDLFSSEECKEKGGISNSDLKQKFGDSYAGLVPIINHLTSESRLVMSKLGKNELFYTLVSAEVATKFSGLDTSARMVYQVIERAGNMGIWTKDIRLQTNIQQQALNKIFKALESRRLIKPVKSVTAKAKKLYMLFDLTPSKELTGGVWYSDLEFDHEFISELRTFVMHCVKRLNGGKGVTLNEIKSKMVQAKVSRIELSVDEVQQLVQTLVYDYIVEETSENDEGEKVYLAARRITTMCDFKWWDVLCPDFHFRSIRFDDGLELGPHEPHYHTA
jgi:DNA-directed RNA polymerase III subunit RPC6